MRVLFPDPEGPMIAVNFWTGNDTVTPFSARTSASPVP
jgi:hypothetical protein